MATADLLVRPTPKPPRDPFPRPWSAAEFERMQSLGLFDGRSVVLDDDAVREVSEGTARPFVFTRKEYYALCDVGFFRGQRVQLVGGVIVQESPMNPPHAAVIRYTTKALERIFSDGFDVRVQLPLDLGPISEPHPDLTVVTGSIGDYECQHPKAAVLVVEVADPTLEDDTHTKASLYAAGGIADYWVIDVSGHVLVFRDPKPATNEPFGFTYARVSAFGRDETVTPLAAPNHPIRVSEMVP